MKTDQNYCDVRVRRARRGHIEPLRIVLAEIADSVRNNNPIQRPQANFLADILDDLVESLDGIRTYRWDRLRSDDPEERARITAERKTALEKTGRIFNRAFGLARDRGRPSLETEFKMASPLNKYCRFRMYGESKADAIEAVCRLTGIKEERLKRYVKKEGAQPSSFDRRNSRFGLARLYHRFLREGVAAAEAKKKVAAFRGLTIKTVDRSVTLFNDHALTELLRRKLNAGITPEDAYESIANEHGITVNRARTLIKRLKKYELARAVHKRVAPGSNLAEAASAIAAEEGLEPKLLEKSAVSLTRRGSAGSEFFVVQHFFRKRQEIAHLFAPGTS